MSVVYAEALQDIIVNIWHFIIQNVQVIYYNYFAAILVLVVQYMGFNFQVNDYKGAWRNFKMWKVSCGN